MQGLGLLRMVVEGTSQFSCVSVQRAQSGLTELNAIVSSAEHRWNREASCVLFAMNATMTTAGLSATAAEIAGVSECFT